MRLPITTVLLKTDVSWIKIPNGFVLFQVRFNQEKKKKRKYDVNDLFLSIEFSTHTVTHI